MDELKRPLLVFDGDCSFCRRWITRWQVLTGDLIEYAPYQQAANERTPQLPEEMFHHSVVLIEPDGNVTSAAHAVFRSLALAGQKRPLYWAYRNLPGFAEVTEGLYRVVAANRDFFDKLDMLAWGNELTPQTYFVTRSVFLRLLGLIYLIAFWSLYVQIDGLVGSKGILPAQGYIELIRLAHERGVLAAPHWFAPTLAWISCSDAALHFYCIAGMVLSLLLIVGLLPLPALAMLWALYLSLTVICQTFLSFQWDALLLEAGLIAIFWAPWFSLRSRARPSAIAMLLLRWLLFRVMFLSAVVKWTWEDVTWRNLTAMKYHFETQPLPTPLAWYAHHMPMWGAKLTTLMTFVFEGLVPLMYFLPRRQRIWAFWLTVLFQLSIALTGNYGFFNWLTIGLAATLVPDSFWRGWVGKLAWYARKDPHPNPSTSRGVPRDPPDYREREKTATQASPLQEYRERQQRPSRIRTGIAVAFASVVLLVTAIQCAMAFGPRVAWPGWMTSIEGFVQPTRSINSYGLFRVMTTRRLEISIEGSDDGMTWKEYAFRYKPGDLNRRPTMCQPHMPRLDWQMWFAALGSYQDNPWFMQLQYRLLTNEPAVVRLLAVNPFADHAPRYTRSILYEYQFTSSSERELTGQWWTRKLLGLYCPVAQLPETHPPAPARKPARSPADDFRL